MSDWKLADFSVNVLSHGGFVEGRYINEDKQANLSVSFETPRDLEDITVAELVRRLDEARENALAEN
ncbi:hypothetical protein [Vreelandella zhanjiangensis]|uniref:hypothetical protein n=1 Tax=Vreelandella zhanjiangensis TaxID=1121960 RepID=UPI00036E32AC|nr:hypothetical protein [Halomonas zhanjiangensis]